MKFIWNEPVKEENRDFPKMHWENAVLGWLNYNGVWPHRDRGHVIVEYNYVYHFFDITIFECWLPGNGKPDDVIEDMRKYLRSSGLLWKEHGTWTQDDGKTRPGVRFWIQAEDHEPAKQRKPSAGTQAVRARAKTRQLEEVDMEKSMPAPKQTIRRTPTWRKARTSK